MWRLIRPATLRNSSECGVKFARPMRFRTPAKSTVDHHGLNATPIATTKSKTIEVSSFADGWAAGAAEASMVLQVHWFGYIKPVRLRAAPLFGGDL